MGSHAQMLKIRRRKQKMKKERERSAKLEKKQGSHAAGNAPSAATAAASSRAIEV